MPIAARADFPAFATSIAGQFELIRELGRGGMGVVYLARDLRLHRQVAIKFLPPDLAADPAVRERFLREARIAAQLSHPNVVPVYHADEVQGAVFFVMSFVEGESLAERVDARGPLPPREAVRVLREVAWALAYAHARGVVHRDIKPENILIDRSSGRVMVGDFGIARELSASRLTLDDTVLGTVYFMSPEQVSGHVLDGRSDLYALGAVAYFILSGRHLFEGRPVPAILVAHVNSEPPHLCSVAPAVPAEIADAVMRCLRKSPDERFPDGETLADALGAALERASGNAPMQVPEGVPEMLTEGQASRLWRRAAQLQVDALSRLETSDEPFTRESTTDSSPSSGYRVEHVLVAAKEAGISRQYVAMALAELPRGAAIAERPADAGVSEKQAVRYLGTKQRSLAVSLIIDAPPARTLRALGAAFSRHPYDLQFRETVGQHPLDGGVLVFDLPGPVISMANASASLMNVHWMATRQQLEASQVQVTLRASPGDRERTEVTMTCDVRPGLRRNVRAAQWIAGSVGVVGGGLSGLLTGAAAGSVGLPVIASVLAVGAGLTAGSVAWYRWLYPRALARASAEMMSALEGLASALRSEEVFGALASGSD
jgi:eukaryotic-like serine/threonine-protein kinase